MLEQFWASALNGGPTLYQHQVDVSCLLGLDIYISVGRSDVQTETLKLIVEELVPVEPLFKELVQPIIMTKSDCILC